MAYPSIPKVFQSTVTEQQQHKSQIGNITPLQELEATIDRFKQQLTEGVDPLAISQNLTQIQPDDEESWTEQMWQLYDNFYEEVSQLEYQATFSPETSA